MEKELKYFLIQSGIVGNTMLFWRHGNNGYSTDIDTARRFTKEEAILQVKMRPDVDVAWPIEQIVKAAHFTVSVENIDADHAIRGKPRRANTGPCCCQCGATENIDYGPDPYAVEIDGDDEPCWLCVNCYRDNLDSI